MQRLFSLLAFGNILNGSRRADRLAVSVIKCLALFVNVFYPPVCKLKTMFNGIGSSGIKGVGIGKIDCLAVIGVDGFQKGFIRGTKFPGIYFKHPVNFIGPRENVIGDIQLPTADMSNALGFIELGFTFPYHLFRPLAFGDVTSDC